jgi:hypothetical protein
MQRNILQTGKAAVAAGNTGLERVAKAARQSG